MRSIRRIGFAAVSFAAATWSSVLCGSETAEKSGDATSEVAAVRNIEEHLNNIENLLAELKG